jgi:hypothetical protein
VPWVVELCGDPDLLTGNAGVLDTLTDLLLVAVGKSGIDVAVTALKSGLDSVADLMLFRIRVDSLKVLYTPHQALTAMFRGRQLGSLRQC